MSLMMRMPEDVTALTEVMEDEWERKLPHLREKYAANRKPDDPGTIEEFIEKKDPEHIGRWVMDDLPELTHHEGIVQLLNAMRWSVVVTPDDAPPFVTSDRPLFMSKTFSEPECYLTLPIGPHCLFVATNPEKSSGSSRTGRPKELALEVNSEIAKQAVKYVYCIDHSELGFIDKLTSTNARDRRRQRHAPALRRP
jgi:hypothetical protein